MIDKKTFDYLEDLNINNYREWFHENKPRYEAAKQNVLATAAELIQRINKFDSALGFPDPRKCIFRIARDTRFSKDKSPYKTHFGIVFPNDGTTRTKLSCYYIHIEPGNSFASCGLYCVESPILKAVRESIHDEWEEFSAILNEKAFKKRFGDLSREDKILKRVPTGFDKESSAAEYLKLTNFYVHQALPDELVYSDRYQDEILDIFRTAKPLNDFLNRTVTNF